MEKTYKPTVAGILDIVAGAGGIIAWIVIALGVLMFSITSVTSSTSNVPIFESRFVPILVTLLAILFIALSILAIVGGVFALKRKIWGLALAGSIGAIFCSTVLGIVAVIFIVLSKNEFEQLKT